MRRVWLITLLLWFQFSCAGDTSDLRMKLDDAVQRRALITERILEWGAPSGKQSLEDGRTLYVDNSLGLEVSRSLVYHRDHCFSGQHSGKLRVPFLLNS